MLFMNIARKYASRVVYQEEAGTEGGSPAAAAPAQEAAPAAEPEAKPAITEATPPGEQAIPEAHAMDTYVEQYAESNPALAHALTFLKDQGINPTDPAFVAAEVDGDFTLLKAILSTKGAPGTEAMVQILEKAVTDYQAEVQAHEDKTTEIVNGVLGEQSEEILAWAREKASPEEREQFNQMFEAGGLFAHAAALLLQNVFTGAGNTVPTVAQVTQGQQQGGNVGALSAREYAAAVEKLARTVGGDPRNTAEYRTLTARREAGRRQGK